MQQVAAPVGRREPAALAELPAAAAVTAVDADRQAAEGGCSRGVLPVDPVGRQADCGELGAGAGIVQSRLQPQEAVEPAGHAALRQRRRGQPRGAQRGGAEPARVQAVGRIEDAVHQPAGIARGLGRRRGLAVDHLDLPALAQQAVCGSRTGQARADHQRLARPGVRRAPRGGPRRHEARRVPRHRDVALAAEAGRALDREADRGQPVAHRPRRAPGRGGGAGRDQAGEPAEQLGAPQLGIARGREAVEVERIGLGLQPGQRLQRVAEDQQQLHPAALEVERVQVGRQRRPLREQLGRQRRRFAAAVHARQVRGRERVLFQRDEDQPLAALRIRPPGRPGGQEVVAQAEAGLQHHEALAALPASGQAVAAQEDMASLSEGAGGGVVDIAVVGRAGGAVGQQVDAGGGDRGSSVHRGGIVGDRGAARTGRAHLRLLPLAPAS